MFITTEELKSVAYSYQLQQIVENDETIIQMAIDAAIEEARSYLTARYDCNAIFSATGGDRNPLILELCKDIALWYIVRLSNVDMLYENVKERYDRAIDYFNRVAKSLISPNLPQSTDEHGNSQYPMRFGSMDKQKYDY
jgi:phage gp36-like protein